MRRAAFAVVTTLVGLVLLLGFKSHAMAPAASPPAAVSTPSNARATPAPAGTTAAPAPAPSSAAPTAVASTVTGSAVATRWGPVQVQVTVANKRITAVTVLQAPASNGRDQQINSYALPQLKAETLAAQSANIDMVSGATYTSTGYIGSLQSALDKAGR
jgi:uncharacterized protein with FMN-binding domain